MKGRDRRRGRDGVGGSVRGWSERMEKVRVKRGKTNKVKQSLKDGPKWVKVTSRIDVKKRYIDCLHSAD